MSLRPGQPVKITRGRLKGDTGTFVKYTSPMFCKVLRDGHTQDERFQRASIEAAMVNIPEAAPKRAAHVPAAVATRAAGIATVVSHKAEGPHDLRVRALLKDVQDIKAAILVLETNLSALLIEDE